jgi:hypothetical protein
MTHMCRLSIAMLALILLQGCAQKNLGRILSENAPPPQAAPRVLAVYEPWFGHPLHINVGYSSQDPVVIRQQIDHAKNLGISGFVVDWYGDREPFLDRSFALLRSIAAEKDFKVAMMYDETESGAEKATDETLAAFQRFREEYLAPGDPERRAFVTHEGRPVIFIFPKGGHTDWIRVRAETNTWNPPPLLIYENDPNSKATPFDGFYAWVNPGSKGWSADGSNWGEDYLRDFYRTMQTKYPDKVAVGTVWPGFDDRKASWGQGRYMSQRCGRTLEDTLRLFRDYSEHPLPFLLIATWNDYEEGTAIERGLAKCGAPSPVALRGGN